MSKYDDFDIELKTIKSNDLVTPNATWSPCVIWVTENLCLPIATAMAPSCSDYDSCHPNQTVATCPTGNCGGSLNYCQNSI